MIRSLLLAACVIAGLIALWQLSKSQTYQVFGEAIARGEVDAPIIALTFDDGPSRKHTAAVLDLLAAKDVAATFFLTGHEAKANHDLTRQIAENGHELGNHSFNHDRLILKSTTRIREELAQTDAVFRDAGYTGPIPFRPPYGQKLLVLPWVLSEQDRPSIMWDVEAGPEDQTSQAMADDVIAKARSGSIVLMHVMYDSRGTSRDALPMIIDGLRERSFRFVTATELLAAQGS